MAFDITNKQTKSVLQIPTPNRHFLTFHSKCSLTNLFINTLLLRTYCVSDNMLGTIIMFLELGVRTDKQVFLKLPITIGDIEETNGEKRGEQTYP